MSSIEPASESAARVSAYTNKIQSMCVFVCVRVCGGGGGSSNYGFGVRLGAPPPDVMGSLTTHIQ